MAGQGASEEPFDTVVVPDFAGARARAYEARTLLFLGSWIEHAGTARRFPLHVACVGEPPASVRWLADRCGARVSVHEPMPDGLGGSSCNKLRGLEVEPETGRFLLLDADIVVLGDLGAFSSLGRCLAAAPANVPRVPESYWRRIYPALGLELPAERIACISAETACEPFLGVAYPEQPAEMASMLPYWNGGVVFGPWDSGLRGLWESHIRTIRSLFSPDEPAWRGIARSDMTGLATAIESLRARGLPFRRLPPALHGNWLHLYRGAPPSTGMTIFHAMFAFGKTTNGTGALAPQLVRFRLHLLHRLLGEWRRDASGRYHAGRRFLLPALRDAHRLGGVFQDLHRRHVRPALRAGTRRA